MQSQARTRPIHPPLPPNGGKGAGGIGGVSPRKKDTFSTSWRLLHPGEGFFICGQDKRIGRKYTAAEISELLSSGRVTLNNCVYSKGNRYSAVFELDDTGKYVNLKLVEFVGDRKPAACQKHGK